MLELNVTDRSQQSVDVKITREWIESRRGPKVQLDPMRPVAVIHESEAAVRPATPAIKTTTAEVTSVFLAGAECVFRCTMCDLWTHTLDSPTSAGAIPNQIEFALKRNTQSPLLKPDSPQWIKLYNSSNFFDPRCVPRKDWEAIASLVKAYDRVIVENHPRLINKSASEFASLIDGRLEVAMGLETVYEPSIRLLNKQMTLGDFENAARNLQEMQIDLRVFILLQPPGMPKSLAVEEVDRSLRFADRCGARHVSIIATRGGNGIMEDLSARGLFEAPSAFALERSLDSALREYRSMIVTADVWGFEKLKGLCDQCVEPRRQRLIDMNLSQSMLPPVELRCGCSDE